MFLLILSNSKQLTIFFGKSWLFCVSVLLFSVQGVPSRLVVSDSVTPWTGAHKAPLSMGCSSREYRSGLPCPPPGDLPDPGIKPRSALKADSLPAKLPGKPLKVYQYKINDKALSSQYTKQSTFFLEDSMTRDLNYDEHQSLLYWPSYVPVGLRMKNTFYCTLCIWVFS